MSEHLALNGVTVIDLGQIYNGPYATLLMAMAGARVIKVESLHGESLRGRSRSTSASYPFALLNSNKESVTLNLKEERGKDILRDLVTRADVLLENYAPGTMTRLGLSAESLTELNPRLIYAAGSGYGQSGPHKNYLAMDITVQAMSGLMSSNGFEGSDPLKIGAAPCDFFGGITLYGAVVSALFRRERTGKGAILDVAMQDSVFTTLTSVLGAYYLNDRKVPPRTGNHHAALSVAPYNVYAANDGHIAIICIRESHWRAIVKAMDRPDLLDDQRVTDMASRARNMEFVDDLVGTWISSLSKHEVLRILQHEGVPTAMVQNVEEVMEDEHLHARGMLKRMQHPVLGEVPLATTPIRFTGEALPELRLFPELGANNQDVYTNLLGMSQEEIEQLKIDGII